MTCHSGGTLEIYVEPHLPAPALWVAGTTPIAGALVELGAAAGWRVTLFDPIADADAFPAARARSRTTGPRRGRPRRDALRRRRDPGHLGRGGAGGARCAGTRPYVGLVASPTRAGCRPGVAPRREACRGAPRRAARAGGHRPRRRDARGGRALDPRRARPGPARPGAVRGRARARDAGRRCEAARHAAGALPSRRRRHRARSTPSAA